MKTINNLTIQQFNDGSSRRGFIALVSILVISAVVGGAAFIASIAGVQEANTYLGFKKGREAAIISDACVEEALLRVRDSSVYSSGSLNVGSSSCTINVTREGSDVTINVTGIIPGPPAYTKKVRVVAKKAGYSIKVISWEEVP